MIFRVLKNNKGSSMILFTVLLVVLVGCLSVVVDIGVVINEKSKISRATDSATLAGAQELINRKEDAKRIAQIYLQKNGVRLQDAKVELSPDGKRIRVSSKREVEYFFARVLGYQKGQVNAEAEARALPVSKVYAGVRPFALEDQTLLYGQSYILKDGAGDGYHGNYGLLALGGTGASNVRSNILNGYNGPLEVGGWVDTEPGNKVSILSSVQALINGCKHCPRCTYDSFQPGCSRVITIVIVESLDVNGRKSVKISGFASFFLENIAENKGKGHTEITGRFIKMAVPGEGKETQKNYGLETIELVR
ncbi:MAG: pilus assembly protein TadG-related protein [Clostridia bacterium]|nr:pilus assembly protein TadG-related protein [Clostridia bacterium]